MSRAIEIIDPESELRISRQRRVIFLAVLVGLTILGYPEAKDYYTRWETLKAARKFSLYLSMLKTRAIMNKVPLEAKFKTPDEIEVSEVSSCGPYASRNKLWSIKLSDFGPQVQFASEAWIRSVLASKEPILQRFCYDPLYGSSVLADGLVRGNVYLANKLDLDSSHGDNSVQLQIEGANADITVD